jgi:hypothetical protein
MNWMACVLSPLYQAKTAAGEATLVGALCGQIGRTNEQQRVDAKKDRGCDLKP